MSMLSIAASGLTATQLVMNTISENVANTTTDGYSRKTATLQTTADGGVTVSNIERVVDSYLNTQLWNANSTEGYYTSYNEYVSSADDTLSSDSMGVTTLLDSFYSALSAASASPDDDSLREAVVSSAESLSEGFNWISENLSSQSDSISSEISNDVESINDLTSSIASLNSQITSLKAQGGDTSSLEDSRDSAVSSLSSLLNVNVTQQDDGSYSITLAQGQPLVSGDTASTVTANNDDSLSISYNNQTFTASDDLGGEIGGLIDYQNDILTPTLDSLNTLAAQIADEFNSQQSSGYDVNGTAGTALFSYDSSDAAATLSVSSSFTSDDLAFSGEATADSSSNTNLLSMLDLQSDQTSAYSSILQTVADKSSSVSASLSASSDLVDSATNSISSVSGVNSDEEAANLLTYQEAYEANAKVVTIASDLFDTLINMF